MGPQIYLILALLAATPATYGYMWVKQQIVVKRAYADGLRVGAEKAATAVNIASGERVAAVQEGERTAPVIPEDRAERIKKCATQSSCRERAR